MTVFVLNLAASAMKWWYNVFFFKALQVLETATPLSLWKPPSSSTGADITSLGGERPPTPTFGTSGTFQTPQENFTQCGDMQWTVKTGNGYSEQASGPVPAGPHLLTSQEQTQLWCKTIPYASPVSLCSTILLMYENEFNHYQVMSVIYRFIVLYCVVDKVFVHLWGSSPMPLRLLWSVLLHFYTSIERKKTCFIW